MANTGYIINPTVIQIFTTGPNSGSIVSSSFTIEFSGSFTSSLLCNEIFNNKVFDPINCTIDNFCINPTINNILPSSSCNNEIFDYIYIIDYNTNTTSSTQTIIEYSLQSDFSGEIGSSSLITNTTQSMSYELPLNLNINPLNPQTPIYFRAKNICSGSISSSLYSSIRLFNCPEPITPGPTPLYPIFLRNGCANDTPNILYYVDAQQASENGFGDLNESTFICYTNNQFDLTEARGYSDGFRRRFFNGTTFISNTNCDLLQDVDPLI